MLSVVVGISGNDKVRRENFIEFLKCVDRQDYSNYELVVVEIYQDEPVYADIAQKYVYIPVFGKVWSGSWAANIGTKFASGDILLFACSDFVFGTDYFNYVVNAMSGLPYALGWSKSIWLNEEGRQIYLDNGIIYEPMSDRIISPSPPSGNVGLSQIFTKEALESIGGMNETFTGHGGDDCEVMYRANIFFGGWNQLDYTLVHLWHGDRVRGVGNTEMWEKTFDAPGLVTEKLKKMRLGAISGPRPI